MSNFVYKWIRFEAYVFGATWTGVGDENCTNPKKLYESTIGKRENLFSKIRYSYFNGEEEKNPKNIWSVVDQVEDGRCFVANPTHQMLEKGIKMITVYAKTDFKVIFTTPGIHLTSDIRNRVKFPLGRKADLRIVHQVYDMVDYGGEKCNDSYTYSKDMCTEELFEKKVTGNSFNEAILRI